MTTPAILKCDPNYSNWPDMINASLTGLRSRRISNQTNGLFDCSGGETTIADRGKRRSPRRVLRSEADMDKVDCVIVGAGVVGLAIARRLAQAGREVIVLEATEGIGTITSSRNSEVIHAGIYYRAGSLMAQTCVGSTPALYH